MWIGENQENWEKSDTDAKFAVCFDVEPKVPKSLQMKTEKSRTIVQYVCFVSGVLDFQMHSIPLP